MDVRGYRCNSEAEQSCPANTCSNLVSTYQKLDNFVAYAYNGINPTSPILAKTEGDTQVTVTWTPVSNTDIFAYYLKIRNGSTIIEDGYYPAMIGLPLSYIFHDLVNGTTYTIEVSALSVSNRTGSAGTITATPHTATTGTLRFIVVSGGNPIDSAAISVDSTPKGSTNISGILDVPDLTMASHSYIVTKSGYENYSSTVILDISPKTVNVSLTPTSGILHFVVTSGVNPLSNVEILINDVSKGYTDTNGIKDVTELTVGNSYSYIARKSGYTNVSGNVTLDVSPKTVNVGMIAITLGTLRFVVTYEGNPLNDVAITVDSTPRGTTNSSGILDVTELAIGASHSYIATKAGYNPAGRVVTLTTTLQTENVFMTASTTGTGSVRFRVNCGGSPCEGAHIWISGTDKGTTLSDGTVIITGLPVGSLSYTVKKSGYGDGPGNVIVQDGTLVDADIITLTSVPSAGAGGTMVIAAIAAIALAYYTMKK
jgi:hypothetical protein